MFEKVGGVDNMSHSYIEKRENDFKNEINTLNQKIELANSQIKLAKSQIEDRDELLVEIYHNLDDNGGLKENTMHKLEAFTKDIKSA